MPVLGTLGAASMRSSATAANSQVYLAAGLIVNLDATDSASFGGSGSTWTDLKGYANATFVSSASKSTDGGGSVIFNGSNYATFPFAISAGRSEFTVEFWVKLNSPQTTSATFYSEEQGAYWQNTIQQSAWYTRTQSTGATGGRTDDLSYGLTLPASLWTHLCFVYSVSGGIKNFYVNGVLQKTVSITSPLISGAATDFRLGSSSDGSPLNGLMRQVRMYSVALTQSQITANYQGTMPSA